MPKTVHKYPLDIRTTQIVRMPAGAVIRSAHVQHSQICIWAEVEYNNGVPDEDRQINIYGTGHPMPPIPGTFIATVLMNEGTLVWHVYVQD